MLTGLDGAEVELCIELLRLAKVTGLVVVSRRLSPSSVLDLSNTDFCILLFVLWSLFECAESALAYLKERGTSMAQEGTAIPRLVSKDWSRVGRTEIKVWPSFRYVTAHVQWI